jgi:hypothetical protein
MKAIVPLLASTLLIPIPQWGTASLIEIIWFAVGLCAFILSLVSTPKVLTDYGISKEAPDRGSVVGEARLLLARGHVRREVIRLLQSGIIMSIGAYALVQPNVFTKITVSGLILTAGLVALAVLVALQSLLDRNQRRHAEEVLDRE